MQDADYFAKARQLAVAGQQLHQHGWVPATSGNFSMRLSDASAIVTASGRHKGHLRVEDFLAVDLSGQPLTEGKPSAETGLHTQLYRRYPEVGAVLHCHSPNATLLSRNIAGSELVLEGYELLKAFSGINTHATRVVIPIFDNTQDIDALACDVDDYLAAHPDCPAYLIRGHGAYCWAADLDGCLRELEALEFLLHCELEQLRLPPIAKPTTANTPVATPPAENTP